MLNQTPNQTPAVVLFTLESENNACENIDLGDDAHIAIQAITPSATLPHTIYDQAVISVPSCYPDAQILLRRRIGYLGSATPIRYSLLAYAKNSLDPTIFIAGAALDKREAWSFQASVLRADFGLGLARVMEQIAALPLLVSRRHHSDQAVN